MKRLLVIESLDLSAIKNDIHNVYLLDKIIEAEIELEDEALLAVVDMIMHDPGEESNFIEEETYIYENS